MCQSNQFSFIFYHSPYWIQGIWKEVNTKYENKTNEIVAGVDVSYNGTSYRAALIVFQNGKIKTIQKLHGVSNEPYRASLFFLKEAPIISQLIYQQPIDLLFVNGHGICHPYSYGLATVVGLTHKISTIGIARELIAGTYKKVASENPYISFITRDGRMLGVAIGNTKSKRPIIVSQGFGISPERTIREYLRWTKNGKIPEPLRLAHIHGKSGIQDISGNSSRQERH